ncbi:hypothetical protein EGW08_015423 [Elysia chlorotica]|uniref:Uncharacterized protein n=1 Tax=Elysia chlorotica TaxID=188477 RepID=A0A3S1BWN1_ELYCH|nr:hypothetical protein EGW08_015423 [Elysia chlorotica]
MGLFMSRLFELFQGFSAGENRRILMLGLDAAGKTTILYKVKLNENVCTIPTIGFNVETVTPVKGVNFTVWDVGGQEKIRQLWRHYYANAQGLLFIVDSADRIRLEEARQELFGIIKAPDMERVPVVVVANKQDLPGALSTAEVADGLGLREMRDRKWYVQGACAVDAGDGPVSQRGLQKLKSLLVKFKEVYNG